MLLKGTFNFEKEKELIYEVVTTKLVRWWLDLRIGEQPNNNIDKFGIMVKLGPRRSSTHKPLFGLKWKCITFNTLYNTLFPHPHHEK
jgi:hypothetical protein